MRDGIIFVLVRSNFLGNIGSVARVMKNFGFSRLRLVAPPKNYKDAEARKMSVGAFDVLKASEVFDTLSDALKDVSIAVGTTSGQQREFQPLPLRQFLSDYGPAVFDNGSAVSDDGSAVSDHGSAVFNRHCTDNREELSNTVAIVFGDERDGLNRDELLRCHHVITVPTNPEFPALNLAQSVGIIAYELSSAPAASNALHAGETPALQSSGAAASRRHDETDRLTIGSEDDAFIEQLSSFLSEIQFTRTYNKDVIAKELRSLYQRAHPTKRELDLLRGIVHKLQYREVD